MSNYISLYHNHNFLCFFCADLCNSRWHLAGSFAAVNDINFSLPFQRTSNRSWTFSLSLVHYRSRLLYVILSTLFWLRFFHQNDLSEYCHSEFFLRFNDCQLDWSMDNVAPRPFVGFSFTSHKKFIFFCFLQNQTFTIIQTTLRVGKIIIFFRTQSTILWLISGRLLYFANSISTINI